MGGYLEAPEMSENAGGGKVGGDWALRQTRERGSVERRILRRAGSVRLGGP